MKTLQPLSFGQAQHQASLPDSTAQPWHLVSYAQETAHHRHGPHWLHVTERKTTAADDSIDKDGLQLRFPDASSPFCTFKLPADPEQPLQVVRATRTYGIELRGCLCFQFPTLVQAQANTEQEAASEQVSTCDSRCKPKAAEKIAKDNPSSRNAIL